MSSNRALLQSALWCRQCVAPARSLFKFQRASRPFRSPSLEFRAQVSTSKPSPNCLATLPPSARWWRWTNGRVQASYSDQRSLKTAGERKARQRMGVSVLSFGLFIAAGFGLFYYFTWEKERMNRKRIAEATKGIGKPKVGAAFQLVDQNGQPWSSEDKMKGRFALVYFGFTHCPDICPEELDKMASMLDLVAEKIPSTAADPSTLLPVFITCDPARDSPAVLKPYLAEFHPRLVGLTGTWEQIKEVCRAYRVYFSTPSGVQPGQDYLVDHSIYFYLMDPEGDFVEAIGRQHTAEQGAKLISDHMLDWKRR